MEHDLANSGSPLPGCHLPSLLPEWLGDFFVTIRQADADIGKMPCAEFSQLPAGAAALPPDADQSDQPE